jgi:hypothetical protein
MGALRQGVNVVAGKDGVESVIGTPATTPPRWLRRGGRPLRQPGVSVVERTVTSGTPAGLFFRESEEGIALMASIEQDTIKGMLQAIEHMLDTVDRTSVVTAKS